MSNPYQVIELFGPPGAGKGTQGKILGAVPGFYHFEMGEALRFLEAQGKLAPEAQKHLGQGNLVPTDVAIEAWQQKLEEEIGAGRFSPQSDTLVLDGLPRNVEQAEALDAHVNVQRIFHLVGDEQTLIDRLLRRGKTSGRADDQSEEVIRHRFDVYRRQTAPTLHRYPQTLVVEIDANVSPLRVFQQIAAELISLEAQ